MIAGKTNPNENEINRIPLSSSISPSFPGVLVCLKNCCFLQDLIANPKCSLLVAKDPEDRTDLVITLHGDSIPVSFFPFFPYDNFQNVSAY